MGTSKFALRGSRDAKAFVNEISKPGNVFFFFYTAKARVRGFFVSSSVIIIFLFLKSRKYFESRTDEFLFLLILSRIGAKIFETAGFSIKSRLLLCIDWRGKKNKILKISEQRQF